MLRVITYHRIGDRTSSPDLDPALVSANPDAFRRQMEHVRRWYRPVTLAEIVEAFREQRPLPPRSVHVTFDDAYRDFKELAWPILRALEIPATVFVPTAYAGNRDRSFWWDRLHRARSDRLGFRESLQDAAAEHDVHAVGEQLRTALRMLPHDQTERFVDRVCATRESGGGRAAASDVLGWDELRDLQDEGVTFGTHTRHHVALSTADPDRVREEIRDSLQDLDRELSGRRWAIAYPYGMYSATVARIAQEEGCVLGFTCEDGLNEPGTTHPLRLRRTNITPRTTPVMFAVRMLPWFAPIDRWRHRRQRAMHVS